VLPLGWWRCPFGLPRIPVPPILPALLVPTIVGLPPKTSYVHYITTVGKHDSGHPAMSTTSRSTGVRTGQGLSAALCAGVLLVCSLNAQETDPYAVPGFTTGGRSIPQQASIAIAGELREAPNADSVKPGELVMRKRFSGGEYRLYKGAFDTTAFRRDSGLCFFRLPVGATVHVLSMVKMYSEKQASPDADLASVYFDNAGIYLVNRAAVHYNQGGKWQSFVAEPKGARPTNTISVATMPDGAAILVDGRSTGLRTPASVAGLFAGLHTLRVARDGFQAADTAVNLSLGNAVKIEIKLHTTFGAMRISSSPPGARVSLNGIDVGVAPVSKERMAPGAYVVALNLDFYKPVRESVLVVMDSTVERNVALSADFGTVELPEPPNGRVFAVDGSAAMARTLKLRAGSHRIQWSGEGLHSSLDTTITIVDGRADTLRFAPVRLLGALRILPEPADAEVTLDFSSIGTGPQDTAHIPTGKHVITATRMGYASAKTEVVVDSGKTAEVHLALNKTSDVDGDGVPDSLDRCPQDPGPRENDGCPGNQNIVVSVGSTPRGASVSESGRSIGVTPIRFPLQQGRHAIRLAYPGYIDTTLSISVAALSPSIYDARLWPSQTFLDSMRHAAERRHMVAQRSRQIGFGLTALTSLVAGFYWNSQVESLYHKQDRAYAAYSVATSGWDAYRNEYDGCTAEIARKQVYRNLCYGLSALLAVGCAVSFAF
jgi:hypothetical protein